MQPKISAASVLPLHLAIPIGDRVLAGAIALPPRPRGLVVLAEGATRSRHDPWHLRLAKLLRERGLATLVFDLLAPDEEQHAMAGRSLGLEPEVLAGRIVDATTSLVAHGRDLGLPIGYLGGGTCAAAALIAAAHQPRRIAAVVTRGGDLARALASLPSVHAATLLLVPASDPARCDFARRVVDRIAAPRRIDTIAGGPLGFDTPETVDEVARRAGAWFVEQFAFAALARAS